MDSYDSRRQILDLSSFFLIEFSDDSEADLSSSGGAAASVEDNDDDAQSICNDSSGAGWDYSNPDHEIEIYSDRVVERSWEEFDEEEEEGEVNMSAKRRDSNSKPSCIRDDEGRYEQAASEMEKNKIFWETCLASGF